MAVGRMLSHAVTPSRRGSADLCENVWRSALAVFVRAAKETEKETGQLRTRVLSKNALVTQVCRSGGPKPR